MFRYREDFIPEKEVILIAKCEDWNHIGYQICKWNGKKFYYEEQPNDMFDELVTEWSYMEEGDEYEAD